MPEDVAHYGVEGGGGAVQQVHFNSFNTQLLFDLLVFSFFFLHIYAWTKPANFDIKLIIAGRGLTLIFETEIYEANATFFTTSCQLKYQNRYEN